MTSKNQRIGIASGGNWIVDRVKTVDKLPGRGMLANIRSAKLSTGGAPANVLADLARMKAPFPLTGVGIVGDDEDGRLILNAFRKLKVNVDHIRVSDTAPTSYTDVMNEEGTGARTFFHDRGANALFGPEHVPVKSLTCRLFHLGYILLLDRMDEPDKTCGTTAAKVLKALQAQGIKTSVDVVSEDSDRFKRLVPPALKYVDYLILNEVETARVVGKTVRNKADKLDGPALVGAVDELYEFGAMSLVAVHMPEGVYMRDKAGRRFSGGSLQLPAGFIKGAVGAGDAFCAGMLYGLHEGWDNEKSAHLGSCCAAASLSHEGATDGVGSLEDVLKLGKKYRERTPPVKV